MRLLPLPILLLGTALGVGCSRPDLPILPTLVVADPDAEINAWPMGATNGTLTIDQNCIKLAQDPSQAKMVTLVFPPGYKLRQFKQGWAIVTSRADVWGLVGGHRKVGGGEVSRDSHVEHFIGAEIQRECHGPYWLVSPEDPYELRPRNVRPPPVPTGDS